MKLIIFVVFCITIYGSTSGQQEVARRYCGRHLAVTMADLCFGVQFDKRNTQYEGYHWPLLAYSEERIKRQGIADECCLVPCTTNVLSSYC
ncbi:bombyxin G-1 [Bombyx mandarina]|uniref:Bombyxin G-1 n=2 Tax=Bombyx TaxID=7090 RepID=BXG1_BOMMO|nr:bombyxin G-1 precursor [Bombyx mori]XP_028039087.1 bombyxin G-1 [Bombyx mandarina]O61271.1 RecName: Full=Bombyxin G-1; Short=BBX-G1; Contains: RecName: Full=Bombyxin G-1 B chain; Contains: RecName: Full=Bombyxin G-1 A chain; Flags: Precursor [Bombyx mori]BAA25679.1 Preprobombyxin G1 [Bombyx mori]BAA31431.1 preprobombyxin G1 [Bombyx mori]